MSDESEKRPRASVALITERVDKETGEIKTIYLDYHGAAFPQKDGTQLSVQLYFYPLSSNKYFVNVEGVRLNLPDGQTRWAVRASRQYMVKPDEPPRTSWSTIGWAQLTRSGRGIVITLDALPPSLSFVIFFHKRKDEGKS